MPTLEIVLPNRAVSPSYVPMHRGQIITELLHIGYILPPADSRIDPELITLPLRDSCAAEPGSRIVRFGCGLADRAAAIWPSLARSRSPPIVWRIWCGAKEPERQVRNFMPAVCKTVASHSPTLTTAGPQANYAFRVQGCAPHQNG